MSAEPKRVCSICGNEFSGAIEFCPVCIRTLNLQSLSAPSKTTPIWAAQ